MLLFAERKQFILIGNQMLKKIITSFLIAIISLMLFDSTAFAQTRTRVRFRRGSTQATVSGRLTGFAKRTFVVNARAGQNLTADLSSGNTGVRFGDGGTSLNYETQAGDNYVFIINDGRATTTFSLTITIN